MIREVKIPRVDPSVATDAGKWSDDGQIALLAGSHVLILSPSVVKYRENLTKTNDFYDTTSTHSIDSIPWYLAEIPLVDDQKLSVGATSSNHCLTDVEWSPTGMSPNCGCLLAVLSTRHEALVYYPRGNPNTSKWPLVYHLNQMFIDDSRMEPPLCYKDVQQLRFHAISWSQSCHNGLGDKWGTSFLGLGTESGDIIVYQNSRVYNMAYCCMFNITRHWITGLKFSSWFGNEVFLAVTTANNTAFVLKLSYNSSTDRLDLIDRFSIISQPGRLQISCISWYTTPKTPNMHVLSITRPSQLLLTTFINGEPGPIQKTFTNINTAISGIILNQLPSLLINIILVSCKGEVFSCHLNLNSGNAISANSSFLHQFIARRLKTGVIPNVSPLKMDVFACIPHKHGTYMTLLYRLYVPDELKYPIVSQQTARLAFLPLIDYEDGLEIKAWPVTDGSGISTWWEIMMLERMCPKEKRKEVYAGELKRLERSIGGEGGSSADTIKEGVGGISMDGNHGGDTNRTSVKGSVITDRNTGTNSGNHGSDTGSNTDAGDGGDDLKTRLEKAFYFNPTEDSRRLLVELSQKDDQLRILSTLSQLVLESNEARQDITPKQDSVPNDIDMALLSSYSQFYQGPNSFKKFSNHPIRLSGKYFEGDFNFSPSTSASFISIKSQSNHVWKRCSITLLPLTTPNLLTCSGCLRKVLGRQSLESQGIQLGPIISIILDTLDVCIYCGGRFYQR